jgi:hypothetical protein
LIAEDHPALASLHRMYAEKKSEERWNKWKPLVLLTLALIGCLLIARMA